MTTSGLGRASIGCLVVLVSALGAASASAADCKTPPYTETEADKMMLKPVCGKSKRSGITPIAKYYVDRFGIYSDGGWKNNGLGKECDAKLPLGKMIASISLLENGYKDKAADWHDLDPPLVRAMYSYVAGGLNDLDDLRAGECKSYPAEAFYGVLTDDRIMLYLGLFSQNIVFRAATLVHETRHYRTTLSHNCGEDADAGFWFQAACPRCPVVPPPIMTTYATEGAWALSYFNKTDINTSTPIFNAALALGRSRLLDSLCNSGDIPDWMKDVLTLSDQVDVEEGKLL